MPRPRWLALLLLVALAPAGAPAALRPRIVNGVFTSALPTVAALLVGPPDQASMICSATLIGCDTVLTAAHCVCDGEGADCQPGGPWAPWPGDYRVFLQHAGVIGVRSIAVHPDFAFPVGDVAVLRLASPVTGIRPTPINDVGFTTPGQPGVIAGFGRAGGDAFDYGMKRAGTVTVSPCQPGISDATSACWTFDEPITLPGNNSGTCHGDSGGPLFVDLGTGVRVAGVTSGGDSYTCLPVDNAFDAEVFAYHAWIAAQAPGALGQASCGTLPQVGDVGATVLPFAGRQLAAGADDTRPVTVAPGATRLRVSFNADESAGDVDLYVRAGAPATADAWDCAATGEMRYGSCEIADPAPGDWYVTVRGVSGAGNWQATATVFGSEQGCGVVPLGGACDDGNACTVNDACTASGCAGAAAADGTPCDDGRACTGGDACVAGACAGTAAPRTGCLLPTAPGAASLLLKDDTVDGRDQLVWKWRKGAATTAADLRDPRTGHGYSLCVFDEGPSGPALVLAQAIPPGTRWSVANGRWRYADPRGAAGGLTSLLARTGAAGRASIELEARGDALDLPALPLAKSPRVTVQMIGANACWSASYSTARRNDGTRFQARSD